ncbi:hypothetical protein RSAG8_00949, partial [Rhizoctonia solani AG-8 WAC10335]
MASCTFDDYMRGMPRYMKLHLEFNDTHTSDDLRVRTDILIFTYNVYILRYTKPQKPKFMLASVWNGLDTPGYVGNSSSGSDEVAFVLCHP